MRTGCDRFGVLSFLTDYLERKNALTADVLSLHQGCCDPPVVCEHELRQQDPTLCLERGLLQPDTRMDRIEVKQKDQSWSFRNLEFQSYPKLCRAPPTSPIVFRSSPDRAIPSSVKAASLSPGW